VLESHGDVEPIEDGWRRDPGIDQCGPQTRTAISERGHHGGVGSANHSKVQTDQRRNVGASLRHRSKHLPDSASGLDISDADLQMPFALFAAADEGRIQADCDRSRRGCPVSVRSQAAGSAIRPKPPMLVGLTGNDRSLKAGQELLGLGQAQAQVRNLPKTFRPADLHQVSAPRAGIIASLNQPQHPPHLSSSSRSPTRLIVPIPTGNPPNRSTLPSHGPSPV